MLNGNELTFIQRFSARRTRLLCKLLGGSESHCRAANGQPLWDNLGQEVKNEGKLKDPPK